MVAAELPVTVPSTTTTSAAAVAETAGVESVQAFAELLASGAQAAQPAVAPVLPAAREAETNVDEAADDSVATPADAAHAESALIAAMTQTLERAATVAPPKTETVASGAAPVKSQLIAQFAAAASRASQSDGRTAKPIANRLDSAPRDAQLAQALATLGFDTAREASKSVANVADGQAVKDVAAEPQAVQENPGVLLTETMSTKSGTAETTRSVTHLREHVGSGAWRDELAAKLTWMVDRGIQSGSLRLTPEHLGPLEVRISVQSDQVSVWFGAAHADTRSTLEQALPRLRELFAAQGLSLADAGVFREPPRDTPREQAYASGNSSVAAQGVNEIDLPRATVRSGLLDAYA